MAKSRRARRQQQRTGGQEQQPKVEQQRAVLDIEQVHLQLFLVGGVIVSENLRIAGQPRLDLHPVAELRQQRAVVLHVFNPLRARADQRHLAPKDVEKLRQLVDARAAQHAADGRDARVVVHGELCAILLRIHDHGAEFDERKPLAVLGVPLLPVEHRPAVVRLDGDGRRQHERARQHDADHGKEDVHRPLGGALPQRHRTVAAQIHERVPHERFVRAVEQHVLHARDQEQPFARNEARIHEPQPERRLHLPDDHGRVRHQLLEQPLRAVRGVEHRGNAIALAHGLKPLQHLLGAPLRTDDHGGVMHLPQPVEQPVAQKQQQRARQPLRGQQQAHRSDAQHGSGRERQHEIGQPVRQQGRQQKRKYKLPQAQHADEEAAVCIGKQQEQGEIEYAERHKTPEMEICLRIKPNGDEQERDEHCRRHRRLDQKEYAAPEHAF